jgi:signal transduction histidine kinase
MVDRLFRPFIRQPAPLAFAESLVLLFGIGWLDLATGHQVYLVLFYSAPIVFAVWMFDNKSAFAIAALAGVLWSWTDLVMGYSYASASVQAWEIATRFAFFFLVAIAGIATKERHQVSHARIRLLEHARKLEQQIIQVSEYEQQRIGRDLHDGLCQYLAAVGCAVTALKSDLEQRGLKDFAATLEEIQQLLANSVKQARDLAHGLMPVELDEAGLPGALQELAASTSRLLRMDCSFEFAGANGYTDPTKATHLYHIAQEAINNAKKHGRARNVELRLSANSDVMSLSIADDGAGFSKTDKDADGVGISIMRYRANVVGGEFGIEERPAGGTIVSCTVPVRAQV